MRKEYTDNLLFDNLEEAESDQLSAFSMETCIRSAAQRMIQAALEAEVEEFLQRAKYDKTSKDEFRGYRGRTSHRADGFNDRWGVESTGAASVG